jgi:uncharacterized protein YkwD
MARASAGAIAAAGTVIGMLAPAARGAEPDCTLEVVLTCEDPSPAPPPTSTTTTAPPAEPARLTAAEAVARLLQLTNDARAESGVAAVAPRQDVADIAARWSDAMAEAGALSHNEAYFSAETRRRLGAATLAENVARAGDVDQAHRALMNSAGHRANLLDPRFAVVGIGAVLVADTWWITQDFVQPRAAEVARGDDAAPATPPPVPTEDSGGGAEVAVLAASPPAASGVVALAAAEPVTEPLADAPGGDLPSIAALAGEPVLPGGGRAAGVGLLLALAAGAAAIRAASRRTGEPTAAPIVRRT